jgi:hypothetical protein
MIQDAVIRNLEVVGEGVKNRGYRNLRAWELGMELTEAVYKLAAELPSDERYGLWRERPSSAGASFQRASGSARGCSADSTSPACRSAAFYLSKRASLSGLKKRPIVNPCTTSAKETTAYVM